MAANPISVSKKVPSSFPAEGWKRLTKEPVQRGDVIDLRRAGFKPQYLPLHSYVRHPSAKDFSSPVYRRLTRFGGITRQRGKPTPTK